jgi:hypothetical protein
MAELADALDSGSSEQYVHAGSSPVSRTKALAARTVAGVFLYLHKTQPVYFLIHQAAFRIELSLKKMSVDVIECHAAIVIRFPCIKGRGVLYGKGQLHQGMPRLHGFGG